MKKESVLNEEQQEIRDWLIKNNQKEPTEKDFPTYMQAHKKNIRKGPYFEDVHYAWENKLYLK